MTNNLSINGLHVPRFLYGTAWKEDQTQRLTELAIRQGFHGIDTANQRKHYHEAGVGLAVAAPIQNGLVRRQDLFLQTKFTFLRGQDHRLPYDPRAPITDQVEQSLTSSLEHLGVEQIDSYLLHGPSQRTGLGPDDWAAWRAMEALHDRGLVWLLGISNVTLPQLQALCRETRVRPSFVQNRCYASQGWDRQVRAFCKEHNIAYQGFSLLTANRDVLTHPQIANLGRRYGRTLAQIIFRFALDVGMIALTGTTSPDHMRQDLDVFSFQLEPADLRVIESLAG